MILQGSFSFKLEMQKPGRETARAGLFSFSEFIRAMGVEPLLREHIPAPGSGRGYPASCYVLPILHTLYGGGESVEDVREIREDAVFRRIAGLLSVPSSSGIGDWLRRMGSGAGVAGVSRVNASVARKALLKDARSGYTLIVDPTFIEADKASAKMTYEGFKGYRPVVATLKEFPVALAYRFKEGNDNGGKLDVLKEAFSNMPDDKSITEVLLDSEYYTDEVMGYLDEKKVRWAIAADKDAAVKRAIAGIPADAWTSHETTDGVATDRELAETVHATNNGKSAFRLVVLRWKGGQEDLFGETYHYHAIATGMVEESTSEVVWKYNHRAHIENHIKELKGGFGMGRMPSGDFGANAVWFGLGVLAYNLFVAQKFLVMPEDWRARTIKTVRWRLVETVGRLVETGRRVMLKIAASEEKFEIYREMRRKTLTLMTQ